MEQPARNGWGLWGNEMPFALQVRNIYRQGPSKWSTKSVFDSEAVALSHAIELNRRFQGINEFRVVEIDEIETAVAEAWGNGP